jgi:hypothetical protein
MLGRYLDTGNPVNLAHPLCAGLTAWWSARLPGRPAPAMNAVNWWDLTGKHRFFAANSPTFVTATASHGLANLPGAAGLISSGSHHYSGSDGVNPINNSDLLFPSATDGTVLIVYRHRDTTLRAAVAFGALVGGGSSVSRISCYPVYADGNVYWDWGGETSGASRLSFAHSKDTNWHVWVFTVGGGFGMRVYKDGLLLGSNAGTPSRTLNASHMSIGGDQFTGPDDADVADLLTFRRALPPADVLAWTNQAFQGHPDTLRRFTRRSILFSPGAGGGGGGANRRRRFLMSAR